MPQSSQHTHMLNGISKIINLSSRDVITDKLHKKGTMSLHVIIVIRLKILQDSLP